jgi:hypothetical protein
MIESIGRGVLDTRLRGYDDLICSDDLARLPLRRH